MLCSNMQSAAAHADAIQERRKAPMMKTTPRSALLALFALALVAAGCGGGGVFGPDPEVVKVEVEAAIRGYLPKLSEAYRDSTVDGLRDLATERELIRVKQQIDELYDQGRYYIPELQELTIESFKTWRSVNAVAATVEVWDVRSYAFDAERTLLSEVTGQSNRVKYQLKKKDDRWMIMYRELVESQE